MKVLAAMSGGVDSAVAAARAVEAGHDVTGVHFALSKDRAATRKGSRGCCSIEDANDASRAADVIGIPFYVWDMSEDFIDDVIDDFLNEYAAGRTPNPCVRCNEHIKFAAVLERARALGFDAVCTGHYAQLEHDPVTGEPTLWRAVDPAKDQSYVLAVLDADQLAHSYFPLGDTPKPQIRAEAASRGLLVADKPDSHDICFIPDGDTAGFLKRRLGVQPGQIKDAETGEILGEHEGSFTFTVGQRRGLHLSTPAPEGQRRYVVEVEPESNTVFVGLSELLQVRSFTTTPESVRWCGGEVSFAALQQAGEHLQVQFRAHQFPLDAQVEQLPDLSWRIELVEPVRAVAPGQTVVVYHGERALASATIAASDRAAVSIPVGAGAVS